MKAEQLQIQDEEFFLKFNIFQMKNEMKISFGQYQKKAKLLEQEYTELIHSVISTSVEDKDEVLHMTIVKFKDEMEALLQEFQRKYGQAMQELDYYAFCIKMEKENVRICDEFVEKVVLLMSYNLFDNQDSRNLIKRCPHCQLIWFKTEGCDGSTTCGNNSFKKRSDIVSSNTSWKYNLQRIGDKLRWEKNPMASTNASSASPNTNKNRNDTTMKPIGCGKIFKWSALPKIEDELILEFFKVKTIDQAKQLIQNGNFTEARRNYQSNVDLTFLN
jgi:hypothetical protein